MEPLMTLDGYRIIENERESRELLNKFYEQKGIVVVNIRDTEIKEPGLSSSIYKQESK